MAVSFFYFIILSLACFRLTRLFVYDKITVFLREPFFDEIEEENEVGEIEVYYIPKPKGIHKFFGELLSCYWCTGIWSAAIIVISSYVLPNLSKPFILILAIAGLASIIETIIQKLS